MTILQKIDEMNEARGWSIYELCKNANIAEATLYSCKRRGRNPSNDVLEKICGAYGITLFQFYHDMDGNSELTSEQKSVLIKWSLLDADEKEVIKHAVNVYIAKKQQKKTRP